MNRRSFGRTILGAGAAVVGAAGCERNRTQNQTAGQNRMADDPYVRPFELEEATIADLQAGMQSGKYTARSITEAYLSRIESTNKKGPALFAVLETNPDALAIADQLDAERKSKGPRGPLHGIPVLLKDNIATADRMTTTAGSLALEGSIAPRDSFLVQKLRDAGAILLGKANLTEFAGWRGVKPGLSGWSGRGWDGGKGGLCRSPYVLDRHAGGSSCGSGAATAANLCAVSIGTETDGSINGPSTVNGIVGIKPTVGLISRFGIIPISMTQDTAGPMTRTVRDAAVLLGALVGMDPLDEATKASQGKAHTDFTQFLDPAGLKGARIGVPRQFYGFHPGVDRMAESAFDVMKRLGAEIIDPANLPTMLRFPEWESESWTYEFKAGINSYLSMLGPSSRVKSLKDIIEFNERNREREKPFEGQESFLRSEATGPLSSESYRSLLKKKWRLSREGGIDLVMKTHRLDALVAPHDRPATVTDIVNGNLFRDRGCATPAALAGYPMLTVPMGSIHGLPVGISFFGRAWSEPTLIKLAYAFEQATKSRRPPKFLPTVDVKSVA
jgi:amidase